MKLAKKRSKNYLLECGSCCFWNSYRWQCIQSNWSVDFRLEEVRLRAAPEELYRGLNNKEITLDLTNQFISPPEKGLQCVVWESHRPSS